MKLPARTTSIIILMLIGVTSLVIQGITNLESNQGYAPEQPLKFSHKVHTGDNPIPCLYCHYGALSSRHAGIPSLTVCMNCHSNIKKDSEEIGKIKKQLEEGKPIEWVKINRLADFVYFSHEQHVSVGKINCQECHGAIEKMMITEQEKQFTMGWCIDCHRKKDVVIPGTLEIVKESEIGGEDCGKCHY